jgi:hypothetical protein
LTIRLSQRSAWKVVFSVISGLLTLLAVLGLPADVQAVPENITLWRSIVESCLNFLAGNGGRWLMGIAGLLIMLFTWGVPQRSWRYLSGLPTRNIAQELAAVREELQAAQMALSEIEWLREHLKRDTQDLPAFLRVTMAEKTYHLEWANPAIDFHFRIFNGSLFRVAAKGADGSVHFQHQGFRSALELLHNNASPTARGFELGFTLRQHLTKAEADLVSQFAQQAGHSFHFGYAGLLVTAEPPGPSPKVFRVPLIDVPSLTS